MNYAVVGTGYWGSNHVRVGAELRDAGEIDELVVCDVDEARAAEMAAEFDAEYVTDVGALPGRVDAATVATPSPTHHGVGTDLLSSGVDIMVEKPLTLDAQNAWDLVETAERYGRTLGVGHIFRHHPLVTDLKRRIDAGEFGEIRYLWTNRFALREPRRGAGVLYSVAVHDVDLYGYLLDAWPDNIGCRLDSFVRDDIDETASLSLGYGETTGVISASWQVPVFGKSRELVVVGSERAARIDYLENEHYETFSLDPETGAEEGTETITVEPVEPLKAEVVDFLDATKSARHPKADGRVGAAAVELLEVATRADATGRRLSTSRTEGNGATVRRCSQP
ncbi:hypothetical protein AUR64_16610 [Haloprofundus marisrubri]|uniref:Uncharacterized protein n=1 Tax=Haloprofundus marisrubri TaxID=1514971 RepID=A0A0W1R8I9_9EURY|nr:Gfo/Idh/MocA family oxidoreductase [Haloprofundus marisrubri]KTG09399.1 hypothetical protein AUR64_16610 [Haloprofundus marisrubri]